MLGVRNSNDRLNCKKKYSMWTIEKEAKHWVRELLFSVLPNRDRRLEHQPFFVQNQI